MDWRDWVFLVIGIWLIIAAFLTGFGKATPANMYNYLITGIITIILSLWTVFSGNNK